MWKFSYSFRITAILYFINLKYWSGETTYSKEETVRRNTVNDILFKYLFWREKFILILLRTFLAWKAQKCLGQFIDFEKRCKEFREWNSTRKVLLTSQSSLGFYVSDDNSYWNMNFMNSSPFKIWILSWVSKAP
jgi:hypothetical protein